MRKFTALILSVSLLVLTGCQNGENISQHPISQTTGVGDILAAATAESETSASQTPSENETAEASVYTSEAEHPFNGADIDLTVMSSNMVYSQVFCMVMEPDEYIGLIVRMEGQFVFYHDEVTGKNYYACIIKDATACCAQGIEFEPTDDFVYPDDFPEEGGNICVEGIFDKYSENGNNYLTLRNAVLITTVSD